MPDSRGMLAAWVVVDVVRVRTADVDVRGALVNTLGPAYAECMSSNPDHIVSDTNRV